jgi:high-affinity nickel-transport protein
MVEVLKRLFGDQSGGIRGRVLGIYAFLAALNIGLWVLALATFRHYPVLLGTASSPMASASATRSMPTTSLRSTT